MPYDVSNPPKKIKDMPKHAQEIFVSAFNSALTQYKDEGKANAVAYAAVKTKYKQNEKGEWIAKEAQKAVRIPMDVVELSCPQCGGDRFEPDGKLLKCVTCGILVESKREVNMINTLKEKQADIIQEIGRRNASADSVRIKKIVELCQELLSSENVEESKITEAIKEADATMAWLKEQDIVKTEDGVKFPAAAFAYVPDAEKPSEWKLRLWEDTTKKITRKQLGAAAAALSPGGLKGNKVEIIKEDLPSVKRKIRAGYRSLDVADDDMPRWVQEVSGRIPLTSFISLAEAKLDKGTAEIMVIRPGFNASKERFYPAEVLARDYKVFEGLKMYADHPTEEDEKTRPERSIKDWVATLKNVFVNEKGEVRGTAHIVESWLRDKLASLRDKGMLSEMGISINAVGTAVKGEIDGVKTNILERIIRGRSVDFVTEAGAGGLVEMYEADRDVDIDFIGIDVLKERRPDLVKQIESAAKAEIIQEAKKRVETEEQIKTLETQVTDLTKERDDLKGKVTESEKAQRKAEAKSKIDEAISKSGLPDPSKARLTERFKDAEAPDGIVEAIKAEDEYVKALTESKVKGMGGDKSGTKVDREALKESWKKLHPDYSEAQLEVVMRGR